MGSPKKSKAEKAATRKAQNERARARKRAQGYRQVSLWVPADSLDAVQGVKVGVVIAEEGADMTPTVYLRKADGSLAAVPHRKNLLEV